jgi:hypothetical protein
MPYKWVYTIRENVASGKSKLVGVVRRLGGGIHSSKEHLIGLSE